VRLVEHRADEPDDGADLLDPPPRVMNGFVALRIPDRHQL
jgi:hypothetical protein